MFMRQTNQIYIQEPHHDNRCDFTPIIESPVIIFGVQRKHKYLKRKPSNLKIYWSLTLEGQDGV